MTGIERLEKLVFGSSRRLARRVPFRPHILKLDAPTVAFTFDDFPASAGDNAAPILEDAGMRGTFYTATGLLSRRENGQEIADADMVQSLHRRGHEIGAHTHDHLNVQRSVGRDLSGDVEHNIREIKKLTGGSTPASFAYPYGVVSLRSKFDLMQHFAGLRGIEGGVNHGVIDLAHLRSQELYDVSSDSRSIEALLDRTAATRGWLIFYTHDVRDDPTSIGCSPSHFANAVELVRQRGFRVETVAATLSRIGATQPRTAQRTVAG